MLYHLGIKLIDIPAGTVIPNVPTGSKKNVVDVVEISLFLLSSVPFV